MDRSPQPAPDSGLRVYRLVPEGVSGEGINEDTACRALQARQAFSRLGCPSRLALRNYSASPLLRRLRRPPSPLLTFGQERGGGAAQPLRVG